MTNKQTKSLTVNKLNSLELSIGFLQNYTLPTDEHHIVKQNGSIDTYLSVLLNELGHINQRRNQILTEFKQIK